MIKLCAIFFLHAALMGCHTASDIQDNPAVGMRDTIAVAENSGEDYVELTKEAINRNKNSLHRLFTLSSKFDGASSEGHSAVLGEVLRRTGDDYFGSQLMRESRDIQSIVYMELLHDFGWGNTAITKSELKDWYPRTFSGIKTTE